MMVARSPYAEGLVLPSTLVMVSLLKPLANWTFCVEPTGTSMITGGPPPTFVNVTLTEDPLAPWKLKVTPEAETPE